MAPLIITELDNVTGAIFARNPYNNEFGHRVAFADMSETDRTFTCDRKSFLGRNRSHSNPAALERLNLSGSVGAGFDPCVAMQAVIEMLPGDEHDVVMILGEGENVDEARALATRYRQVTVANKAIEQVSSYWRELLETVVVKTPDPTMDTMLNHWLPYQVLSCRVWARSAFYQSGGAYGFRDQLQDVCALVYAKPEIAREQILRAAARQFKEGDHWWRSGRGVRSR
jgi:cellobiose phosphorylase